jgi:hypothetical protein
LTDISKSVASYLHDEQLLHRVLAVDLCSKGFHVWQHYINAMEILRALFTLATTPRKEAISVQNVSAQARLAILQIASSNTALFMTTLGLDILTPPSLEHRRSVLQIVAFIIRKVRFGCTTQNHGSFGDVISQRPLVLQPNIPKLMEAVAKSLDPNLTTHREAVLGTATEIIGCVVKTYFVFLLSTDSPSSHVSNSQIPNGRLSHGKSASGGRLQRWRDRDVRPQDRDPAVCAGTT